MKPKSWDYSKCSRKMNTTKSFHKVHEEKMCREMHIMQMIDNITKF